MNALQSYSSDDESGNESPMHKNSSMSKPDDPFTNYDDVGMDISEDSGDDDGNDRQQHKSQQQHHSKHQDRQQQHRQRSHTDSSLERQSSRDSHQSHRSPSQEGDAHKDHADKPRSSLQERLLGLASGERRSSQGEERSGSGKERRDRSRSRSRDKHTNHGVSHSGRGRDERGGGRGGRDDDRRKREDERRGRRSRSKSRERRRSRSRERKRSRSRSRDRERHRRDRSRSRDRKRPMDIRKEAQQKLAALKASNPDLTTAELLRRSMEAQINEVEKQTGIALPSYYNPAAMNPVKFAEQERKKKLLWGNKSKSPEAQAVPIPSAPGQAVGSAANSQQSVPGVGGIGQVSLWANTKFSGDKDGKMAEKFKRLMGVKNPDGSGGGGIGGGGIGGGGIGGGGIGGGGGKGLYGSLVKAAPKPKPADPVQDQEAMFTSMERQYEVARLATHTQRGFGLGFSSQSFVPK